MTIFYSDDGKFQETKLYINGVKQSNITDNYRKNITETVQNYIVYIGARSSGIWSYKGIIDDIKVYNRALSEVEIKQQSQILGF